MFMAGMFALFFLGILFELFVALPVIWTINRIKGFKPYRMQWIRRKLVAFWMMGMGILGLLRVDPPLGKPCQGPAVVVCNHPGLFDVMLLIRDIPRLTVLVKYALGRQLPLDSVFKASGYVYSPDMVRVSPLESIGAAIENVKAGYKFQLFPEGTRSPKGGLRKFSAGAFRIASRTGVPIQPILIKNDPPFLSKEDKWHLPPRKASRIRLEYWEPLPPPEEGGEREMARQLEERFRRALGL